MICDVLLRFERCDGGYGLWVDYTLVSLWVVITDYSMAWEVLLLCSEMRVLTTVSFDPT